jgi:hypothetical protein
LSIGNLHGIGEDPDTHLECRAVALVTCTISHALYARVNFMHGARKKLSTNKSIIVRDVFSDKKDQHTSVCDVSVTYFRNRGYDTQPFPFTSNFSIIRKTSLLETYSDATSVNAFILIL